MHCDKGACCAQLKKTGNTLGLFLALNYTLAILFCLLFDNDMYTLWQGWLPKFEWISWKSYFVGLVETFAYGWYFAILLGVARCAATSCCASSSACGMPTKGHCHTEKHDMGDHCRR